MSNLLEELKWRGLLQNTTDEGRLSDALQKSALTFYCGFDPTAASLHHGNLVQLILMRHLQLAGHKPIVLVGGGTGLIGDPRKTAERVLNDESTVVEYAEGIRTQFARILDFGGDNATRIVNNFDWLSKLSAIGLLRDVGKYFRLSQMLAKEIVASRLNSEEGISYTEFSYQILQAYDFYQLHKNYGVTLQTGGSDQWGNLTAGLDFVRKKTGDEVHVMTTPLITKSDGTKFGKSEGGAVWLNENMMSPYAFYQFWLNTDDNDAVKFLKVFTFLSRDEIAELEVSLQNEPHLREAQKTLAKEVTTLVHGEQAYIGAVKASEALFKGGDFSELDAKTAESIAKELGAVEVQLGSSLIDAFISAKLVGGKNEAMRAFKEGGLYVNNARLTDETEIVDGRVTVNGRFAFLRRGKKNIAVLEIEGVN
ncbi:MAG: tyrosine--tRNA ligase [Bifidobacteriaceae bacterium]|jgi:tyrosyl-tRNA synthetase|nr:tyrosine--tRNA ligase [Bifidobacteriaceae bacterium]